MKNIIKTIFLLIVICFSFFYTDRVMNLINHKDPLMTELTSKKESYKLEPINANIDENTIIPGIKGHEIDVEKSYEEMKLVGVFQESSLVYKDIYPSDSLYNNRDKYIIKGNPNKNAVAILVNISEEDEIEEIKNFKNITLFINTKYLTIGNINKLKDKEIYSYGNSGKYNSQILTNDNSIINRNASNKSIYCLSKEKNNDTLNICNKNGMYVVIPTVIGDYLNVRNNLVPGNIIYVTNIKNMDLIIKYINSKGIEIIGLGQLIKE